jgi:ribosomal protein S18 acetylase RimI-like enzyme
MERGIRAKLLFRPVFRLGVSLIIVGGESAGWLRIERNADHFRLDYLVLAPEYQRRGIGGAIVGNLLRSATEQGLPVRLNVLRVNPAKALYERLGFREVGGDTHRFFMESKREIGR